MSETRFFEQDPGAEVLTGWGSVMNVIREGRVGRMPTIGTDVAGFVGALVNDRGAPNVPVILTGGSDDIASIYGGFKAWMGGGPAQAYNGNLPAYLWKLAAPIMVVQPVDLALRDKTITDVTAALLPVTVQRGWKITGTDTGEVFTTRDGAGNAVAHNLTVGDTVDVTDVVGPVLADVIGGVVATTPTASTFTLTGVTFAADITAGRARPRVSVKNPLNAYVLPAGTRIMTGVGGFVVATLQPVAWSLGDASPKTVRVQKVTGTEANLNTVATFLDAPTDTGPVYVVTTTTTPPYAMSDAERALRYTRAFQALGVNAAGRSVKHVACDRTEALITDALSAACADHRARGFLYKVYISPPYGTTWANAEAASGVGSQRATLVGRNSVHVIHGEWMRSFLLDQANLVGPGYLAPFSGAIPLAASTATIRPEQNNARPSSTLANWGAGDLAYSPTSVEAYTHFKAGIMVPELRDTLDGPMPAHRDGIVVSGAKSADERLYDFLAQGLVVTLDPFRQESASAVDRQDAEDAANAFISRLAKPPDNSKPRIKGGRAVHTFDELTEQMTVTAQIQKNGNQDIITIRLGVTAEAVALLPAA